MHRPAILALLGSLAAGCAVAPPAQPLMDYDRGALPEPDLALTIPRLGPCTDNPDRTLHLASNRPVTVLVHGCFASSGRFRALAEVFAFHGQQTACFDYDYRDSLMQSSSELRIAVDALANRLAPARVTVIGHSQGGLIARKALVGTRPDPMGARPEELRLVTVSAPYGGIASADACGWTWLNVATAGLHALACWAVSGDKWYEITDSSGFIRRPGPLVPQVDAFLKVDTDETGSCRAYAPDGRCTEDDFVFSLEEQRNEAVVGGARMTGVTVKAGHVEIVGDRTVAPVKLIQVLQEHGVMERTAVARRAELGRLLARLYELESPRAD